MQAHKYSDEELLHFLKSNEVKLEDLAIRDIYLHYYGLIESLILKNNGNKENAKSVFHDGLIVLIHHARKKDFKLTSTLKTYLYSICRNKWLMELRKQKNKKEVHLISDYEWISIQDDITRKIELDEGQKVLVDLLQQIGEECKKLIHLYYYMKLRMVKIAEQLGITNEAAVKNRKARCLKKLRLIVGENKTYQVYLKDYLKNLGNHK